MERGILLLWRENNKLLYLDTLLEVRSNKKKVLLKIHPLQRQCALAEVQECRKHTLRCGVMPEMVACSATPTAAGKQIQLRNLEMLSAWGVYQCVTT